jgi:hypothetical protein
LSKVHDAIKRFSEDIDLTIGTELLGFTGKNDPNRIRARKEREKVIEKMMDRRCSSIILLLSKFRIISGLQ